MCNNYECGCRERISCIGVIGLILAALFTLSIGIIIGAVFYETFLPILSTIIVLAIVLFILLVIWAIAFFCRRRCCD